jgi:predicted ArsR family transcriptional regulator
MSDRSGWLDPVTSIAALGDANRRRLYELVAGSPSPVGRDDAATSLGLSRELAAFHLDRLVAAGLLETEYRRRSGRSGPGAGRPAKFYRRARADIAVSLPPRAYDRAAGLFADALAGGDAGAVTDAVARVAREQGAKLGDKARSQAGRRTSTRRLRAALVGLLEDSGFEPEGDPSTGGIRMRNCPYRDLADRHRDLTCGMNVAWAAGVVEGLRDRTLDVELRPEPDYCCVVLVEG